VAVVDVLVSEEEQQAESWRSSGSGRGLKLNKIIFYQINF
jgi:hypothetical protein